ncbi:MAG: flagellar biosynthesis anti-sigma factor FlgM [Synergistaceae bacterium]|nr:flagellar biosynthesis anti-sigma factor FlgM [Synergistaceae bacterium]
MMVGRVSGQYNTEALSGKKSRRNISYGSGYTSESDDARFSTFGTLLSKAQAEMKNIPDVREDVVAKFKSEIEAGTYKPPLEKLANVLYMAGILDTAEEV